VNYNSRLLFTLCEQRVKKEEEELGAHLAQGSWLLSLVWLRMVEELVAPGRAGGGKKKRKRETCREEKYRWCNHHVRCLGMCSW
jgi:hypothetical protein